MTTTEKMSVESQTLEILKEHGLDYRIDKVPTIIPYKNASINTGYFTLVNAQTNEALNQVKPGYTVSQNFDIVKQVVLGAREFRNLSVVKAGSLNGGRKIYIQLAIEGDAFIGDDIVKRYVTIIDSNDGTTSLAIGIGDLTMSCKNQFYFFYKKANSKYRHSASITGKIEDIHNQIEYALTKSMRMTEIYKKFQSTKITQALKHDMVQHLLGNNLLSDDINPKALANMNTLYNNINIEIADKGLNLWGLHSGVTRWTTHEKQAPKRANGRIESSISGTNYKFNENSLNFALEHAGISI